MNHREHREHRGGGSPRTPNLGARGLPSPLCSLCSLWLIFFLLACGYRWDDSAPQSLSIPFIAGDEDGTLTAELIRAFASSTRANVVASKGRYRLEVSLSEQAGEIIGFRIDSQVNNGKQQKNIVADEGRRAIAADVCLYDTETGEIVLGPSRVEANVDYDYVDGDSYQDLTFVDSSGVTQTILAYSLGQLESSESAREAGAKPLYRQLSRKIVDLISANW